MSQPTRMDDLTEEEKFKLGVDNNKDIMVIKVVIDDMPTALKLKKVEEEAEEDPTYQELKWTGHDGKKSNNPDLAQRTPRRRWHQAAPQVVVARHGQAGQSQSGIMPTVPCLHTNTPKRPPTTHHGALTTDGTPER